MPMDPISIRPGNLYGLQQSNAQPSALATPPRAEQPVEAAREGQGALAGRSVGVGQPQSSIDRRPFQNDLSSIQNLDRGRAQVLKKFLQAESRKGQVAPIQHATIKPMPPELLRGSPLGGAAQQTSRWVQITQAARLDKINALVASCNARKLDPTGHENHLQPGHSSVGLKAWEQSYSELQEISKLISDWKKSCPVEASLPQGPGQEHDQQQRKAVDNIQRSARQQLNEFVRPAFRDALREEIASGRTAEQSLLVRHRAKIGLSVAVSTMVVSAGNVAANPQTIDKAGQALGQISTAAADKMGVAADSMTAYGSAAPGVGVALAGIDMLRCSRKALNASHREHAVQRCRQELEASGSLSEGKARVLDYMASQNHTKVARGIRAAGLSGVVVGAGAATIATLGTAAPAAIAAGVLKTLDTLRGPAKYLYKKLHLHNVGQERRAMAENIIKMAKSGDVDIIRILQDKSWGVIGSGKFTLADLNNPDKADAIVARLMTKLKSN